MNEIKEFPEEWNIIPIKKDSKKPLIKWESYQKEKFPRETLVNFKNCNYGVICGEISNNLIVLDLDIKKKNYFNAIYEAFKKALPVLANTQIVSTPHGYHLYYYGVGFVETRNPNKNLVFVKKGSEELFRGLIKTNFANYLNGFDVLGNNGYAIIPPSQVNGLKYEYLNDDAIKTISKEEYEEIRQFFLLENAKQPREMFIDIVNGKIDLKEQSIKTGKEEFLYWDSLYRELFHNAGLLPEEIFEILKTTQPEFKQKRAIEQLKYHPYTESPYTNEKLKEMFPEYFPKTKKIQKSRGERPLTRKKNDIKSITKLEKSIMDEFDAGCMVEEIAAKLEGKGLTTNLDFVQKTMKKFNLKFKTETKKIEDDIISKEEKPIKKEITKEISATIKESEDTNYEIICNEEKVIYRKSRTFYNRKTEELDTKRFDTIIINDPFQLKNIYYDQNSEFFYEIQIGKEEICRNKKDLLDFIENERNYGTVSGRFLKECVSVILREFVRVYTFEPKEMYVTLGVFIDKNDELLVAHINNENIKIYGINAFQKRTIERCKKKGLDTNGELIKTYYDLFHYQTYPEDVRLTTFGHSLISVFFNALRNDIDIFFMHFWITALKSVGKTVLFKLGYADLFGVELKTNDDINSPARFTENCTDTTSCMPIDDIDKLDPNVENQIKTAGTTLTSKQRMTKEQKTNIQDTYRTFSGTANSDKFLAGDENEALRGRCLISRDFKIIESIKELKNLEEIREKIHSGGILGYFILNKAVEYVKKSVNIPNMNSHEKLKLIIKQNKEKIREYFEMRTTFDDPRRLTIYTLLYTAWEMWNFIFQEAGLQSNLLEEILDYTKNDKLLKFIQKYEENMLQMTIDDVLNILEFYEEIKTNNGKIRYENARGIKILDTLFVNEYDKWAKIHGYETLVKLTKLGDMLSKILKKDLKPKTIRVREIGGLEKDCLETIRGIEFDEIEMYARIELDTNYDEEIYNRIMEIFTENNTDKLLIKEIEDVLKLDYDINKIEKNMYLMIFHGKFFRNDKGELIRKN